MRPFATPMKRTPTQRDFIFFEDNIMMLYVLSTILCVFVAKKGDFFRRTLRTDTRHKERAEEIGNSVGRYYIGRFTTNWFGSSFTDHNKGRGCYRSGAALRENDQKMIIFDFDTK